MNRQYEDEMPRDGAYSAVSRLEMALSAALRRLAAQDEAIASLKERLAQLEAREGTRDVPRAS